MWKLKFILRQSLCYAFMIFFVVTVTFWVSQIVPCGPFCVWSTKPIGRELPDAMDARYKLGDNSIWKQYLIYIKWLIFHFDFGPAGKLPYHTVNESFFGRDYLLEVVQEESSVFSGSDVYATYDVGWDLRLEAFRRFLISAPVMGTVPLWLLSIALAFIVGVPVGVAVTLKQGWWFDHVTRFVIVLGASLPIFFLGVGLMTVFDLRAEWTPCYGWKCGFVVWEGEWKRTILLLITESIPGAMLVIRLVRASVLEIIQTSHVRTVARGLSRRVAIFQHILRNVHVPLSGTLKLVSSACLMWSCVAERIFDIRGIGRTFLISVVSRDYPTIMGAIILYAVILALFYLIVDSASIVVNSKTRRTNERTQLQTNRLES